MITNITSKDAAYGVQEYVCDFEDEILKLSTDKKQGSLAFVIETSEYYMLSGERIWEPVEIGGGGGSSGGGVSQQQFDEFKEHINTIISNIHGIQSGTGEHSERFNHENNAAQGDYSHAEGIVTEAIGIGSHAEGYGTIARGHYSHAEGYNEEELENCGSFGEGSHSEGHETAAFGDYSHAEGEMTIAGTVLTDFAAHAEGGSTMALKAYSHAEGVGTIANSEAQHSEGKYNIEDNNNTYLHIAGNGTERKRSNAYTLDLEGNAWYSGDIYVGSTSGTNKDEGSKKIATENYVDGKIGDIEIVLDAMIEKASGAL